MNKQKGFLDISSKVIPETVGFDSGRLGRIHEHIARRIRRQEIAGAATIVARDGQVVHCEAQGFADLESGRLLENNAIFQLASMTKPIIAAAIMILIEEGRIYLTDPICKFIPEFRDMGVAVNVNEPTTTTIPVEKDITIHDLLTHSCGLGQGPVGLAMTVLPKPEVTLADYIPSLAKVPLDFQPGTQTGYSPLAAFDILGRIVEIVSGLSLDLYLERYIFEPLGMTDMTFVLTDAQRLRKVTMYTSTDQGLVKDEAEEPFSFIGSRYFSGAAGLYGTMEDYFRFALMLTGGGALNGTRILSPRTVQLMGAAQLPETLSGMPRGQIWGLGMRVITDGAATGAPLTTGSFGWSGAWGTHFWIDPREKLTALILINVTNAGGAGAVTAREFEMAVMQSITELRSNWC